MVPKLLSALLPLLLLADEPKEVDFASLSDFDYVEGMELPSHVTELDGKKIKISGFMRREDGGNGATDYFMLINDACGCEGMPFLNEALFCAMPAGETTEIKPSSVTLTGTLYVGEERDSGVVISLYTFDVDKVE